MYLENSPRIALYNANPITLLGRGIQCIYEGSFAWLAIATHPLFAGDYYMEEDDYPDLLPQSLHVPSSQIPYEQKLVASNSEATPPPTHYVAPTPSVMYMAPLSPRPLAATETDVATLTTSSNVAGPLEQRLPDNESEHTQGDDPTFLRYWRTPTTEKSDCVPVIHEVTERSDAVDVSTPSTPPALSTCPSGASTLPTHLPDYEDETQVSLINEHLEYVTKLKLLQTPHEEPVQLLTLPSLPLEHTPWPNQSQHCLSPLKSSSVLPGDLYPTSEPRKRRSRRSVHILEPEPRKRTKRHMYKERTLEQSEEGRHGPLNYEPIVHSYSEHSDMHPYYHRHHHGRHGRHRKSRRKDRIYDRAEADASLEVHYEQRHESSPPYHSAQSHTTHPRYTELTSPTIYYRHHQGSRREEERHDRTEIDSDLEEPFLHRYDEYHPPSERLARPSTPHPRRGEPSATEERLYAEADEFLDRMAEQLFEVESTLHDLKREKRHSPQTGNSAHDTTARERKERRRRSAPYASRPLTKSTSAYEYTEPPSERRRSKTKKIRGTKAKARGTPPFVDDIGTLGLGTLSLAQPQATYADTTSARLVQSSAVPRSLNSRPVARSGPNASQLAEGALELGSLAAALPMQRELDDGELSILFQGVQLNVGSESSEYQHENEVPPSITQSVDVNQQWNDIDDLGNVLTQVQLGNEVPEQEQTRPLTIRIPSMAQLQARKVARNTTVVKTPPTPPPIE
ncbi:hypothetical protein C0992_007492 [Termitomyces sp. T32_za158]|nr:hypothetical protein C0992_007492 [Termitomyces sp. T32_za158]